MRMFDFLNPYGYENCLEVETAGVGFTLLLPFPTVIVTFF